MSPTRPGLHLIIYREVSQAYLRNFRNLNMSENGQKNNKCQKIRVNNQKIKYCWQELV